MEEKVIELMMTLINCQTLLENKTIELRKLKNFKAVSRTSSFMNYPDNECPSFSTSLNADLLTPINNDLHCLSLSFTFFLNKERSWQIHSELGWSSFNFGFEEEKLIELKFENFNEMLKTINPLIRELLKDFDNLTTKVTPI